MTDEALERAARAYDPGDVREFMEGDIQRAFMAGAKWRESAYIPLVEAAEALSGPCDRTPNGKWCLTHAEETPCSGDDLRAALVQVPGQQQADTEQGGV